MYTIKLNQDDNSLTLLRKEQSIQLVQTDSTVDLTQTSQTLDLDHDLTTVTLRQVGLRGLPGEKGDKGDKGDSGDIGTDKNYFATLSGETDITITHNLDKYPSVTIIDSAGDEVHGEYKHLNTLSTRLKFSAGFSGKAIFN